MSTTTTTATKAELKSTTALVDVSAFNVALPAETAIKSQASIAFADDVKGGELLGSAVQRMAYAVTCECELLTTTGQWNHSLAGAHSSKESAKEVSDRMVGHFAPASDVPASHGNEAKAAVKDDNRKRAQLVKRGTELAILFASRGMVHGMFNVKLGVFQVWATMLYPAMPGVTPLGRLRDNATIMLDGRPIVYLGKNAKGDDSTKEARASVAHLRTICIPSRKRVPAVQPATPTVTAGASFDPAKVSDVAKTVQPAILIAALHTLFVTEAPAEHPRMADMPDAWSKLSTIMQRFDEWKRDADWATPRDSESKAEIAKRKQAARK